MKTVTSSYAQTHLQQLIGKACKDDEVYVIENNDKRAVLMALDDYHATKETLHLLSSKANRDRLDHAVAQIESFQLSLR